MKGSADSEAENKCAAVSAVHSHGMALHVLVDTGGTPNIFPSLVTKKLSLRFESTRSFVTVATETKSGEGGKLAAVPMMSDSLQAGGDFFALKKCFLRFR